MTAARGRIFAPIALVLPGLLLVVSACSPAAAGLPVGMSNAAPERAEPREAEAPHSQWPDYAAAREWPEAAPPVVAVGHRRDGALMRVRVEPSGLAAYRDLAVDSPMPSGARVVAWLEARGGQPLAGYLLEKREGVWTAQELDARGGLVPSDAGLCLRCHQLAPTDYLFGLPAAGRPPAAAASGPKESIAPPAR